MNMLRIVMTFSALALIAGCSTIPKPIAGEQYSEAPLPSQSAERSVGAPIRWGGTVIETRPQRDRTCIEVLAKELDRSASPQIGDDNFGRFIACRNEFIDPEIFVSGREITAVGTIARIETGKVGEFDYHYPVVNADAIYLWPERTDQNVYPYYGSFYYSSFYHRGFYRYPYSRFGFGVHHGRSFSPYRGSVRQSDQSSGSSVRKSEKSGN